MSKSETGPWRAQMIHPVADKGVRGPGCFVARTFDLASVPGGETLVITAWGLYRAFINGVRVGEDLLTPGWTCYDKRLSYQTYDVSALLKPGTNRIEIWVADGWFRSKLMWTEAMMENVWGDKLGVFAEIRDASGAAILATDAAWEGGETAVRQSGIYFGEIFDSRVAAVPAGGVTVLDFDPAVLVAHEAHPVRELAALEVVKSWADDKGRTIFDFGQNSAGYCAIEVKGAAGARVTVEHAEILDRDGAFYNLNFRHAEARLEYVLSGKSVESYRPMFTFQGFRYARVTIEGAAELVSIRSIPVSSVTEIMGSFTCGNPLLNRFVQNTIWSQRSNFIDIPTDCPQRGERLGWTGDIQVFAGTACYFSEAKGFLEKFTRDVMADQREDGAVAFFTPNPSRMRHNPGCPAPYGSTGWGDVISVLPWTLWLHYGDREIIAEALPAMLRWNDFVWSISNGPIVYPVTDWNAPGFTFGDWLQPQADFLKALPTMGDDAAATIYLYISSDQIAHVAEVVGDKATATRMRARADAVKAAFQKEFISETGRLMYDDQTTHALALLYDLVPEKHLAAVKARFVETVRRVRNRIGTGFIGTPALLPALAKIGEIDLAAKVLQQEDIPGWLFQVKMGATTVWERWDALTEDGKINDPIMNSYNHYAYGAVCQWLFEAAAGFRPDPEAPGFAHVIFEPLILDGLSPVQAHHQSQAGRIEAGWTETDGQVTYAFEIPETAKGTLVLQETYRNAVVDGKAVASTAGAKLRLDLPPGRHVATFQR